MGMTKLVRIFMSWFIMKWANMWCDLALWISPKVRGIPVGIPGNRDPDSICTQYDPFQDYKPVIKHCLGDGHYLCSFCRYLGSDEELQDE